MRNRFLHLLLFTFYFGDQVDLRPAYSVPVPCTVRETITIPTISLTFMHLLIRNIFSSQKFELHISLSIHTYSYISSQLLPGFSLLYKVSPLGYISYFPSSCLFTRSFVKSSSHASGHRFLGFNLPTEFENRHFFVGANWSILNNCFLCVH